MSVVRWPLGDGRPLVQVIFTALLSRQECSRRLLADTGAGSRVSRFELLVDEDDCLQCGHPAFQTVSLGGAYAGVFPLYAIRVGIPELQFDEYVYAVGVPTVPQGFDGIAGFRFLSRFTYGNLGDPDQFGLQTP